MANILIVEDEVELAQIFAEVVMSTGKEVEVVHNGAEAMKVLDAALPQVSLILCDISMPVMNGLEFLKQALTKYGYVPFVMLTAHADQEKTAECLRLGAIDYLVKPFDLNVLKSNILPWVEIAKRQLQLRSDPRFHAISKMEQLIRVQNTTKKAG